ncbi:MAG: RNA polymerase sigma factor [Deltaproteobacteria bacterium]|nr:RNA polymerase sigma factor [Deltaproteobacteria bacterium]MBN2670914.1 RNA polymerase sigma factor [Deltaproteobacteria bacterium]
MNTVQTKKQSKHKILSDLVLVERAVSGDHSARETLAVAVLPRVRKLVYLSYGNRPDYDDVVQIAMVTIFRDLPGLRNFDRFTAWLDTVVYNVVRTQGRKRIRLAALFSDTDPSPDSRHWDVTPEDENIGQQLIHHLHYHLDKIAPKKRTAAVMSMFFGYVDSEVAGIMNCSVETAKKRIQHGRKELLERVQRDPGSSGLVKEATK